MSNSGAKFIDNLVTVKESTTTLVNNIQLLKHTVKDQINTENLSNGIVIVLSPVDMGNYNL